MSDIQFVRNTKYGTIGVGKNGWTKEVCNVSWNQKGPKLDLREWSPDYKKMSRGITLTKQEAKRLLSILAGVDFEEFDTIALQSEQQSNVSSMPVQNVMVATVPQECFSYEESVTDISQMEEVVTPEQLPASV